MIIAVVSKTNGGKDTVAKYLKEFYGIPMVVSYTTRPMRDYETDGIQHYFVSQEKMDYITRHEDMIAYTKNEQTGIEYCATVQAMSNDTMVYIINPDGIRWFKENGANTEMVSIYIDIDESLIIDRGVGRNDNLIILTTRLASERDEFDKFKEDKGYDYIIDNNSSLNSLYNQVDDVMCDLGFKKIVR